MLVSMKVGLKQLHKKKLKYVSSHLRIDGNRSEWLGKNN